jgi:hypothetical protein
MCRPQPSMRWPDWNATTFPAFNCFLCLLTALLLVSSDSLLDGAGESKPAFNQPQTVRVFTDIYLPRVAFDRTSRIVAVGGIELSEPMNASERSGQPHGHETGFVRVCEILSGRLVYESRSKFWQPVQMWFHPSDPVIACLWHAIVPPGTILVVDPDNGRDDTRNQCRLSFIDLTKGKEIYEICGRFLDGYGFQDDGRFVFLMEDLESICSVDLRQRKARYLPQYSLGILNTLSRLIDTLLSASGPAQIQFKLDSVSLSNDGRYQMLIWIREELDKKERQKIMYHRQGACVQVFDVNVGQLMLVRHYPTATDATAVLCPAKRLLALGHYPAVGRNGRSFCTEIYQLPCITSAEHADVNERRFAKQLSNLWPVCFARNSSFIIGLQPHHRLPQGVCWCVMDWRRGVTLFRSETCLEFYERIAISPDFKFVAYTLDFSKPHGKIVITRIDQNLVRLLTHDPRS